MCITLASEGRNRTSTKPKLSKDLNNLNPSSPTVSVVSRERIAASPCTWLPHVLSTPLDKTPLNIRRAFPFTVTLRLPARLSSPTLRFPLNSVSGFPLPCLNSGIPYFRPSHRQEPRGPPKFFGVSLASHARAFRLRQTSTPSPHRASRIAFGHVKTLGFRNKLSSKLYQHKRRARSPLRPTGFSVYASPVLFVPPLTPPQSQDSIRVVG
jgi:hypothetical protein